MSDETTTTQRSIEEKILSKQNEQIVWEEYENVIFKNSKEIALTNEKVIELKEMVKSTEWNNDNQHAQLIRSKLEPVTIQMESLINMMEIQGNEIDAERSTRKANIKDIKNVIVNSVIIEIESLKNHHQSLHQNQSEIREVTKEFQTRKLDTIREGEWDEKLMRENGRKMQRNNLMHSVENDKF